MEPTERVLTDRAKEPSTWVGLLAMIGGVGAVYLGKPTLADPAFWGSVAAVASGLVNIFTKERKKS